MTDFPRLLEALASAGVEFVSRKDLERIAELEAIAEERSKA